MTLAEVFFTLTRVLISAKSCLKLEFKCVDSNISYSYVSIRPWRLSAIDWALMLLCSLRSNTTSIWFVKSLLPIADVILETATFDPHALKNPKVLSSKWLYQREWYRGCC